jgi:hypothetical protein
MEGFIHAEHQNEYGPLEMSAHILESKTAELQDSTQALAPFLKLFAEHFVGPFGLF